MKMKVYRDSDNTIQNIGEWDYMITQDEFGFDVINNPLPQSYSVSEEHVIINADGSRFVGESL